MYRVASRKQQGRSKYSEWVRYTKKTPAEETIFSTVKTILGNVILRKRNKDLEDSISQRGSSEN